MTKRLVRSRTNRVLAGVLGGIAAFFGTDTTLVRFIFVAFLILSGGVPGIIVYLVGIIIIPNEPLVTTVVENDPAAV